MVGKNTVTWIVLADGARAHIVQSMGAGGDLTTVYADEDVKAKLPSREINADRPGRTFDSGGEGRHAYEPPSDPHRKEKADFIRGIADILEDGANKNAYERLILIAPPQALGDLRGSLSKRVSGKVANEVAKDLVATPLHALPARLEGLL